MPLHAYSTCLGLPALQLVRASGWQGLFSGLGPSLIGTTISQVPGGWVGGGLRMPLNTRCHDLNARVGHLPFCQSQLPPISCHGLEDKFMPPHAKHTHIHTPAHPHTHTRYPDAYAQGVYFYLYSLLRDAAVARRGGAGSHASGSCPSTQQVSVGDSLLMAALAGMGNVLLTNPIWMVATRMQAQRKASSLAPTAQPAPSSSRAGGSKERGGEEAMAAGAAGPPPPPRLPPPPATALGVIREVYGEYGLPGFWKGVEASLVMVINPSIQYALYEWLRSGRARLRSSQGAKGERLCVGVCGWGGGRR
jgi:hypothetical protein